MTHRTKDWIICSAICWRNAKEYTEIHVPDTFGKRRLLRSLMNVRPPIPASEDFLNVQDAYLRERLAKKGC